MANHRKVSLRCRAALGLLWLARANFSLLLPTSLWLNIEILVRLYDASSQRKMLEISTSAHVPAEKLGAMYFYEVPRLTLPRQFRGILAVSGESEGEPMVVLFLRSQDFDDMDPSYAARCCTTLNTDTRCFNQRLRQSGASCVLCSRGDGQRWRRPLAL